MKILMLCDFFNENLEYQENLLVKYYVKHGHTVTVVASTFDSVFDYYGDKHDNKVSGKTYQHDGATIIKLPYRYNIINRLRAYTRIDQILADHAPDLIYVHDIMLNFPECIKYMKNHPDCRMIMDYHADYSNSGNKALSLKVLHGIIRKRFLDQARPYLSRIFPVVPAGMRFLHEIYKVPLADMEVLPLGADTDLGAEIKLGQAGPKLRQAFGIPSNEMVIFTGGKLTPAKQTQLLIEAVKQRSGPPIHLMIVGEASPEDAAYKQQLVELAGDRPNIHFLGWVGRVDIYKYLDMADLAVFPASQSVLWKQAISMGLPLIVGNTGHQDISYLNLEDNIIILQKEEIRTDRIASAIGSVIDNPRRLREMSEGAVRVTANHLDWNKLIKRTLQFNIQFSKSAHTTATCLSP